MPASIIASLLSFLITGIYVWFVTEIHVDMNIKISLLVTILANSVYFFYFEALTEIDNTMHEKLKRVNVWQWYLRLINQTLLFSLWFLLEINTLLFFGGIICLYLSFIIWDRITKSCFENRFLFFLDIVGLCLSLIFIFFVLYSLGYQFSRTGITFIVSMKETVPTDFHFLWGLVAGIYVLIPIVGILVNESDLLHKIGWSRSSSVKLFTRQVWSKDELI